MSPLSSRTHPRSHAAFAQEVRTVRTHIASLMDSPPNGSRRHFVLRSACTLVLAVAQVRQSAQSDMRFPQFDDIEAKLGGRLGVAALDTRNGARLSHRSDERFAMCSTFKWMLAAAVLAQHDRGGGILERHLSYGPKDLLPNSPVTKQHVAEGSLTITELCKAAVETSDNTAANALLKFIGGPSALTRYLQTIGDHTTRLDRVELALNTNISGDPRDTTTPNAMIATMQRMLVGDELAGASRDLLLSWMKNCQTGLHRLRAGLPPAWTAGDKTGTGDNGAVNDNAIIWPTQRPPILVAAYLSGSHASPEALDAAHARIGTLVAKAFA
ncbi:MAG: class A beta-lactamase, partial [Pseudomonadota bacterium]|nr:class A beta-lactamase [Pseudomonadota bacterium]